MQCSAVQCSLLSVRLLACLLCLAGDTLLAPALSRHWTPLVCSARLLAARFEGHRDVMVQRGFKGPIWGRGECCDHRHNCLSGRGLGPSRQEEAPRNRDRRGVKIARMGRGHGPNSASAGWAEGLGRATLCSAASVRERRSKKQTKSENLGKLRLELLSTGKTSRDETAERPYSSLCRADSGAVEDAGAWTGPSIPKLSYRWRRPRLVKNHGTAGSPQCWGRWRKQRSGCNTYRM